MQVFHSESIFFRRLPDPGIRGSLESGSPGVPRGLVYSDGRRDRRGNRATGRRSADLAGLEKSELRKCPRMHDLPSTLTTALP